MKVNFRKRSRMPGLRRQHSVNFFPPLKRLGILLYGYASRIGCAAARRAGIGCGEGEDERRIKPIGSAGRGRMPRRGQPRDRVHEAMRRRYFSQRTEEAYVALDQALHLLLGRRHPADLGETEVTAFLNHLAVERKVAPATQNQALSALLFLYRGGTPARMARWGAASEPAAAAAGGADASRGRAAARLLARGEVADREPSLRFRAARARMSAPAGKGCGAFVSADPRARRKGRKGPGDDAAGKAHQPAAAPS